ncbi:aromatic ring-hydroxylating oxygenase subunit alpha [Priestia flexa]|uniref:aromatic ring-hydroxylating oxygenase subunit alpha n=1 Tax=Priestia flexa TaxID=86664 RepID=UPI00077C8CC2|nr:aromatic ring-hydroxylating dioxygenase subunit alpha [Priestia flexa]MCM3067344.1 aromatic ring-hydroxylating dioxygenase subunit alpha [Priestia flexa]MED4589874.1 aromatic ring-hydroxylating dioxygenase subunit alpha [Priestia flexa]QCS54087.1 aromatic ring-hydroxylating dioxygenase subunit alpha [Priestia flexa]WHX79848.1 aromatic ring-hydroxylating dioxygenase subunit alpha [Priestia flexa]
MFKDAVLAKEWLPVAYSQDLGVDPLAVKVLEERVVLFRVRGAIKAFKDLCIHRGAALSLGKVKDDCIVCPYHGWEYNVDGQCKKIPQQPPNRAIPLKAKAIVYQCREVYGMIWVRLSEQGSDAAEPLPYYEEYNHPSFKTVHAYAHTMNAAAPRVVENFLDVSHLAFVHEGSLGHPDYTEIPDYKVNWRDNHYVSDEIEVYADADGTGNWSTIYYTFEILRPTVARLKKVNYQTNEIFSMLFAVLPQEQLKSTVFALVSRNYELDKPDEYFQEFQQLIIEQDTGIVESQKPEELPLDLQAELHLNPDRVSIAYRKWLGELGVEFGSDVGRKAKTI